MPARYTESQAADRGAVAKYNQEKYQVRKPSIQLP